jgi:hypothetical protein
MDSALLLDLCVAIATALCVALLAYGIWLSLPELGAEPSEEKNDENEKHASEPLAHQPRPRIRAGTRTG